MLDIELMINTRTMMCLKRFLVNKDLKSRGHNFLFRCNFKYSCLSD